MLAALRFQFQQAALDRADGRRRNIAVFSGEGLGVLADEGEHRPQVLQVEQQQAVVVGHLEHQVEHAALRVVEVEHATQQQRSHVGDGGAHRVAHLTEGIPEGDGIALVLEAFELELLDALGDLGIAAAGLRQAGEVALHVGQKAGHADVGKVLGQGLQGDGLAGAGGAGDESVAVGHLRQDVEWGGVVLGDEQRVGHGGILKVGALILAVAPARVVKECVEVFANILGIIPNSSFRQQTFQGEHSGHGTAGA